MGLLFVFMAIIAFTALMAGYIIIIRPWQLKWGATDEEVARAMPGDDIVKNPSFDATRAVTINARPEHVWPWILQIGYKKGGWYGYDLIDNLGTPSAKEIIPEYQQVAIGDHVPINPSKKQGFWVKDFEKNQWMLWWNRLNERETWLWVLDPVDDTHIRLITRVHIRYKWLSPWILFYLMLDIADVVMVRKCMLGIKQRAEALAARE